MRSNAINSSVLTDSCYASVSTKAGILEFDEFGSPFE